ncbi:hypothetical protein M413DRAFT_96679 [Hebeloma cylindrosporum]|uniref:Uncharacterized protein n=1 Tax=Hebeloma cylindrosporum TaxID=76867 RepID=A0A0C2YHD8_HEBCY|nr:hypothetical protein M413DRAFT_96679 [Hebeloma cylindrosporum h7]
MIAFTCHQSCLYQCLHCTSTTTPEDQTPATNCFVADVQSIRALERSESQAMSSPSYVFQEAQGRAP